jgi:transposase
MAIHPRTAVLSPVTSQIEQSSGAWDQSRLSLATEQSFEPQSHKQDRYIVMQNYCGVDTSKQWLDCFIAPNHFERFENNPDGIGRLAGFVQSHGATLVVMEASGGVERMAFLMLWELKVACAIVNPRCVRDFAKAMGRLEKTDRLDAGVIALYAATKALQPMPPPSPKQQRLSALAARMRQVVSDLTVQKQRLHTASCAVARQGLLELIGVLKRQSKDISAEISRIINADPLWAAIDATLRSVKGVADRTVATLMADLPELGTLPAAAISKIVGVAPLADDSGKRSGLRHTCGGRAGVRSILFLVADIVRKYDESLSAFRDRLVAKGKPKMVIRIALAHKLLIRLNAKVRDVRLEYAKLA